MASVALWTLESIYVTLDGSNNLLAVADQTSNGYNLAELTSTNGGAWSLTSFAGKPGCTQDGTDDAMVQTGGMPNATGGLLDSSKATATIRKVRDNQGSDDDRKSVYLTGQTASIGTTTLLTAPAKGLYQVRTYLATTTVGSGGTVLATMGFTDDAGATTQAGATCNLAAADRQGTSFTVEMDGASNLTYATTVAGATGSPQYSLRVFVERIADVSPTSAT